MEEETEKFIETFGWGKTKHLAEKELISATARHFYELGCRRTAEKYDEIEYKRQRADVCEGFDGITPEEKMNHPLYLEGFEVGRKVGLVLAEKATIPAERLEGASQLASEVCYPLENFSGSRRAYRKGFKAGAGWQKEEMMKEAVEGCVTMYANKIYPTLIGIRERIGDTGDKVKIIIVKED